MRFLVIGGSGLIGAHITAALRARGHEVTTVARTPKPGVDNSLDLKSASVDTLRSLVEGLDGVVYGTRSEEQHPLPKPIYPQFRHDMVDPVVRLFTAARAESLTRGLILGSYYTYFDRLHPDWRLRDKHVYVRCRAEQAAESRALLPTAVIELPFVLGRAGARTPNWSAPPARWASSRFPLLAPPGGTAVVSARTVAEVAVDALENSSGADIPIADRNLTWSELLTHIAAAVGRPRKVHRLPAALIRAALPAGGLLQSLTRKETGVTPAHFADLVLSNLFIEPATGRSLDAAFAESFPRIAEAGQAAG
ncbi:NAD-dependent epimerase/dehydratase family protein [Actinoplanes sp. CA-142083]|uniref:NAD-dependent epimerase/dehydratase family protein n=1 Tax=Actinoplanes sp. CA-142083 TaxID=3239903 RepID=UPI003D8AB3AC